MFTYQTRQCKRLNHNTGIVMQQQSQTMSLQSYLKAQFVIF